ncbi:MAG: AraC family transcriptional regulator [Acidobacteria bacterium]|nr:AraC family transcriptional regulator [Acidobacteriota bacterium]
MEYREYLPAPVLRPYVARYWTLAGAGGAAERVLPDGRPEFVVHLADPFANQARCLFVGQQRQAVSLQSGVRVDVFGVRLHPAGATAFLRMRQSEMAGRIIDLDSLWNRAARHWEADLHDARSTVARIELTDGFLAAQLAGVTPSARVQGAIGAILEQPGSRMEAIAAIACVSRRQLEREFLDQVGLPPKVWARVVRFQRALAMRRSHADWPWARIALETGYYDQAHLIGDCRRITGLAPIGRESAETAMERMLVANFQDGPAVETVGSHA